MKNFAPLIIVGIVVLAAAILLTRPHQLDPALQPPTDEPVVSAKPEIQIVRPQAPAPGPAPESLPPAEAETDEVIARPPEFGWGACVIYGTVMDPEEEPAGGVKVAIARTTEGRRRLAAKDMPVSETVTADDGSYRFAALPDGHYVVCALAADACGYRSHLVDYDSDGYRDVKLDIKMRPYLATTGRVTNAEHEPVEGASVVLREGGSQADYVIARLLPVTTDASGKYAITYLWEESYAVEVTAGGYAPSILKDVEPGTSGNDVVLYAGGSISGRVTFKDTREPARGKPVVADNPKGADVETVTDDKGMYRLDGLSTDEVYLVTVRSEDYVVVEHPVIIPPDMELPPEAELIQFTKVSLDEGRVTRGVDILLSKGGSISGTVTVSETGEPLPGAKISLRGTPATRRQEALTGEDGSYVFPLLSAGLYIVECEPPEGVVHLVGDHRTTTTRLTVAPEEDVRGMDFSFQRGMSISGRVTDRLMNGIEGARLAAQAGSGGLGIRSSTNSDALGNYRLTGIPRGLLFRELRIMVKADGYVGTLSDPITLPTERDLEGIDFVLEDGASVSGHIVDTNGRIVSNASIELVREPELHRIGLPAATTDAHGRFEIGELGAGTYRFRVGVHGPDSRYSQIAKNRPITVRAGETITEIEVVIGVADEGIIEGHAVDEDGNGVPRVKVSAETTGGSGGSTTTDISGHYRVEGLGEGAAEVMFRHPDHPDARLTGVPVGTMDADVVMLRRGGISGRVMDARTRRGLRDFEVRVTDLETRDGTTLGFLGRWGGHFKKGQRAGEFTIEHVYPGVATLKVSASGYGTQEVPNVVIGSGQITTGVEVYLSPGAVIQGYVSRNGKPVTTRVAVTASPADDPYETAGRSGVDTSGFYRITDVPAGTHVVVVKVGDAMQRTMSRATVQVAAGQVARVDFALGGRASITGTVASPAGYTIRGVLVRDASATEPFSFERWVSIQRQALGWTLCGRDGSYQITDLSPATYNLTAVCAPEWESPRSEVRQTSRIVSIEEGQRLELNFAP